ncbi:carbohydrate porin [Phormidesmis priestleyi]
MAGVQLSLLQRMGSVGMAVMMGAIVPVTSVSARPPSQIQADTCQYYSGNNQQPVPTPVNVIPTQQSIAANSQIANVIDIKSLQRLSQRYKFVLPTTISTIKPVSRYEFASVLSLLLDHVNQIIAAASPEEINNLEKLVSRADLETFQQLQTNYAAELAAIRGRVDSLEARTAMTQNQQFSTITKLQKLRIAKSRF